MDTIAAAFIAEVGQDAIVEMHGEMGAGKTTFIAACCRCLHIDEVSSPTFSIVNEYRGGNDRRVFHFDLYRLKNAAELVDIGFEEYLEQRALVFIEWPEIAAPWLESRPKYALQIEHSHLGRTISWQKK